MAALPKPDLADGPVRELFDALHELHHKAGWPSLRQIAKDVGCSHTTVWAAFAEPKVPRWGLLELIVETLGGDTGAFHRRWLAASSGQPSTVDQSMVDPVRTGSATIRPRQLIADVAGFTGRRDELAVLDAVLLGDNAASGCNAALGDNAAPVAAISGTAGVGKTALAVHWAHRVADRFPDGQLYLNLRGFDPTGQPVTQAQAVRALLDAFEVTPERIPVAVDAQEALYRSIVSGRRVLLVLDNARGAEQVRPLLPGAATCRTVVTSRNPLGGLVAAEGAHPLALELMPVPEARELVARRVGAGRVAAEPAAVARIVERCAGLPLALTVVAARAATHPWFGLAAIAEELTSARGRLDAFDSADPATDVRAVISWSYLQLSPEAARLFRLLGRHPGPDVTTAAAASLAGAGPGEARRLLAELAGTHLVAETTPGRYRCHDLLHAYAVDLANGDDPDEQRAAVRRMLDHYLHTAHRAALLLNRYRHPITLDRPRPGVAPEPVADHARALAWLTAERPVLLAAARLAAADGFERHAWQLAWALTTFLDRRGHWPDWLALHEQAVDAADRLTDEEGRAYAHRGLGLAHYRLGEYGPAQAHLTAALGAFAARGDRSGQAHTELDVAWLLDRQGRVADALAHAWRAHDLHEADGHRSGQARALNSIGWFAARLGDHAAALAHCHRALRLFQELEDRIGEAASWDSLGYAHHQLRAYDEAGACYRSAVRMFREAGDRYHEAESLTNLGNTLLAADDDSAYDLLRGALEILDELGHPDAAGLRDRLPAATG